jgi:hypothetical protein
MLSTCRPGGSIHLLWLFLRRSGGLVFAAPGRQEQQPNCHRKNHPNSKNRHTFSQILHVSTLSVRDTPELEFIKPEVVIGNIQSQILKDSIGIRHELNRPLSKPRERFSPANHKRVIVQMFKLGNKLGIGKQPQHKASILLDNRGIAVQRTTPGTSIGRKRK